MKVVDIYRDKVSIIKIVVVIIIINIIIIRIRIRMIPNTISILWHSFRKSVQYVSGSKVIWQQSSQQEVVLLSVPPTFSYSSFRP